VGIEAELAELADPERAAFSGRYLGIVPGGYGEGDVLLGIPVPEQRRVARRHRETSLAELERLLASEVHEHRFVVLVVLTLQFERADGDERERLAGFYLAHRDRVNNWDLVDSSAPRLLVERVARERRGLLDPLLASDSIWDRRIAVLATFPLIRAGEFAETLHCCERLLSDRHDLIHKATGWMLREVGKRDEAALRGFLDRHASEMPRTMLRYAIERLPADARERYMAR
jgi:3-methyladenine DNA glycosylase AlkD